MSPALAGRFFITEPPGKPKFFTSKRHDKILWDWHIICPILKPRTVKQKVPDAGKDWGQKENMVSEDEMADCITDAMDMNLANFGRWWGTRRPGMVQSMRLQRVGHDWATEQEHNKKKATLLVLLVKDMTCFKHRLGNQLQLLITGFRLEVCIWFLPFPSYKNLAKPLSYLNFCFLILN